jgi:2-iminobutanoate/2-iminopropanoate deaminase
MRPAAVAAAVRLTRSPAGRNEWGRASDGAPDIIPRALAFRDAPPHKMNTMIEYPVPSDVSSSPLPFSPATKVGNLIFVSGQASTNERGEIVSDTFENEFRRSIENVRRILRACGSDLHLVARVNSYVKKRVRRARVQPAYREYFSPPYPARTTITNCLESAVRDRCHRRRR